MAVQSDNGKIKRVRYRSRHLITPLVKDMLAEGLTGSTCVLTKRNEEALQIAGLLMKSGRQAKLIQSNEGFSLYNLLEIRYFLSRLNLADDVYIIHDDLWENAKRKLAERFGSSLNLESCLNLIQDFEAANPKYKYKSDLEIFIRESVLEDFVGENMETIFVSTIHKAKGREFDNVFLMLDLFDPGTNEAKRQLYVAMTRAKHNLTLYDNGNYLNSLKAEDMQVVVDSQTYLPPQELVMQLSHRDVQLDFFLYCRHLIKDLNSGEFLSIDGNGCHNSKGQAVVKFSKQFLKQIESMRQKNYVPRTAKIRFIVYWQKENTEREVRIVLPELYFEKILP